MFPVSPPPRIGGHRAAALPSHKFIDPTPREGQVLQAAYIPFLGGSFGTDFQVRAHIYSNTVRYKQFVKGTFKYNGVNQVQPLNAGNLHEFNFLEDGNANGVYGVRGVNIPHQSVYQNVHDANGIPCSLFIGNDTPADNLGCPSGTWVEINLTFRGVICDVASPNFVYVSRMWHVRGIYRKP